MQLYDTVKTMKQEFYNKECEFCSGTGLLTNLEEDADKDYLIGARCGFCNGSGKIEWLVMLTKVKKTRWYRCG